MSIMSRWTKRTCQNIDKISASFILTIIFYFLKEYNYLMNHILYSPIFIYSLIIFNIRKIYTISCNDFMKNSFLCSTYICS